MEDKKYFKEISSKTIDLLQKKNNLSEDEQTAYVEFYKNFFNLKYPIENGWLSPVHLPDIPSIIFPDKEFNNKRSLFSLAYYLLEKNNFNPFHKLKSFETWQLCEGGPLILHLISPKGEYHKKILHKDLEIIEVIYPNWWQSAELGPDASFVLISHIGMPAFSYEDHEKGDKKKLLSLFPHLKEIIKKFEWNEKKVKHVPY
jgi:predicted cupin superfamily sugar epimerase